MGCGGLFSLMGGIIMTHPCFASRHCTPLLFTRMNIGSTFAFYRLIVMEVVMFRVALSLLVMVSISGCLSSLSGDSYSRDEARTVHQVEYATIEGLRPVVIEGTKTPIGVILGGAMGGIGGSAVGRGRGQAAATVLGAAVGAMAGATAEEMGTRSQGDEITLRREDGQVISLIQERSPRISFKVGDRVRMLRSNGIIRVAP